MKLIWVTNADSLMSRAQIPGMLHSIKKAGHCIKIFMIGERSYEKDNIIYLRKPFNRQKLYRLKLAFVLLKYLYLFKADVIITDYKCGFVAFPIVILKALSLTQVKIIMDIRTVPIKREKSTIKFCNANIQCACRHFDGISVISDALRDYLFHDRFEFSKEVCVWHSGVDFDVFDIKKVRSSQMDSLKSKLGLQNKFIVFYHGSIGYMRGVNEVVCAFSKLKEITQNDIHFLCLGSGTEVDNIKKYIIDNELDNVTMLNPVPYYEVFGYIALSHICIVPLPDIDCWQVSSPLKLYEYLSMGKPIIMTDILPHREVFSKRDEAIFIHDIQPETIAKAIMHAYQNQVFLREMGQRNYKFARKTCSWDWQARRLLEYLKAL